MSTTVPAPEDQVPDPEGTPTGTPPEVDWEARYNSLQPEFTRVTQEAAELRQYQQFVEALSSDDQEIRSWALNQLGIEVPTENEPDDELTALQQRLDKLEQGFQTSAQQSQVDTWNNHQIEYMENGLDAIAGELGRELTEEEVQIMSSIAVTNRDNEGMPDMLKAYDWLKKYDESQQQRWATTKKTPKPPGNGVPGEPTPDLSDPQKRVAWMVEQAEARSD